jgi:hypothetical protein
MPSKIEEGDELMLQLSMTRVGEEDVTVQFSNGSRVTLRSDSEDIVQSSRSHAVVRRCSISYSSGQYRRPWGAISIQLCSNIYLVRPA